MNILSSVSEFILSHGYLGIFIATMLEYACFPVSSEVLFPFIGYCAARGGLNIVFSVFISTIGAMAGCSICYVLGRFGEKFLSRFLYKRVPKLELAVDNASRWFVKKGGVSVLIGRVFPLIRTYISIPAGMAKMNYLKFILFTALGAAVWNIFLISLGFFLGEHWEEAGSVINNMPFKGVILILAVFIILCIIYKKYFSRRRSNK